MAEWNKKIELDEMDEDFLAIRSLFLAGSVNKMYRLAKQSPTKVSKLLGMNYESYHEKLLNPEKFSELHINTMAYAIGIDPTIIHDVIQKEIRDKVEEKMKAFENKK